MEKPLAVEFHSNLFSSCHRWKTKTSIHFFSSHCLMNVLMRHRHDLLHQSGVFFSSSFFFISALSTRTLFPLLSVECVFEYRHWTQTPATCFCHQSFFFSSALPSAADALCLACRRAITEQPKVTLMKTEGAFCLSALPSHAVHPPISAVV